MPLTGNKGPQFQLKFGTIQAYTSGAAIYRGAIVALRLATGKVHPAEADNDDSLKQLVIGYSREQATAAEKTIRVQREGRVRLKFTGGTPAVGTLACVYDDETVQAYDVTSGNIVVGRITEVIDANTVYVDVSDRPKRIAESLYD